MICQDRLGTSALTERFRQTRGPFWGGGKGGAPGHHDGVILRHRQVEVAHNSLPPWRYNIQASHDNLRVNMRSAGARDVLAPRLWPGKGQVLAVHVALIEVYAVLPWLVSLAHRAVDLQCDTQTDKQTDKQTERQTDRHTHTRPIELMGFSLMLVVVLSVSGQTIEGVKTVLVFVFSAPAGRV